MAKIRVHELAKELNLTNKAILTKLKAMNIEVKSHMSSLEDEVVEHIKLNIFGNKQKDQDSKTVSVIRRKKNRNETPSHPTIRRVEQSSTSDRDDKRKHLSVKHTILKQTIIDKPLSSTPDVEILVASVDTKEEETIQQQKTLIETSLKEEIEFSIGQQSGATLFEDSSVQIVSSSVDTDIKKDDTTTTVLQTTLSQDVPSDKNEKTGDLAIKEIDIHGEVETSATYKKTKSTQTNLKSDRDINYTTLSTPQVVVDTPAVGEQQLPDDEQISSEELSSDSSQDSDSYSGNDKKKKRKKKQKKSEPAKIIKLAVPIPPPPPPVPAPPKKREYAEKIPVTRTISSEKDKVTPQQKEQRASYDNKTSAPDRDRQPYNRERTGAEPNYSQNKAKPSFDREKTTQDRDATSSDRGDRVAPNRERTHFEKDKPGTPSTTRSGGKSDIPFTKIRNKKDINIDIPFIPSEIPEKDDAKSKRKKSKLKKKKWGDDDLNGSDVAIGQKKKKSVVEGKDLYEQDFLTKKSRKKDSKNKQRLKIQQKTQITVPKAIKRRIRIDETIDLSELAKRMSIKANEMIQKLMGMGIMVTVNQTIDFDTAALVAAEFDYEVERAAVAEDILSHVNDMDSPEDLIPRSPVVTIMGHVDHGKTSLLDVIRKSKIVTGEAGGITQHIGAYSVATPNGGIVTFLDTPGHAAFTSMRSRGAKITDIVVLVVAADDGVMPQTVEAINHSKAAGVPVVVAINKMDKPDADPDRVMRELADHGLLAEEWGGDVIFAKVSAKKRQGIEELLDLILLQAEILELKANPNRLAKGHVVEARLDAGRGPVATVLVQQGTLKTSQPVVCGLHSGKIRLMTDDMGKTMDTAGPSTPVEIVGLSGVPEAGDEFIALASEKDAKNISESRMQKERAKELAKKSRANLEKLFANMGLGETKQLKLIIKADVHGSLEALNESLVKLSQEEVDIKIVHSGTGAINESDVSLAAVSDAIIIGFNVRPTPKVREMAKEENVDMRFYDIIYNVINDIKTALTGLMPSTFHENILGRAEIRDIFVIPGKGTIAGCFVQDGKVTRGEKIRLLRDGVVKCDSTISSLRRFKDDAKEVTQGYECGIGIEKFNDVKVGDIIECYEIEERKASIDSLKESTTLPESQ